MIKKLFFTAALLAPGLAYGADPSANLPIQIVPASAVPAPAQAAGFNNLIINDNFQDPSFANTANWLDCAGAGSPKWWRAWVGFGSIDGPCSAITQATDPNGGQLALRLHWQDSYFSGNNGHGHNLPIQTTDNNGNGRRTPLGFYIEVRARSTSPQTVAPGMGTWSYTEMAALTEIDGLRREVWADSQAFTVAKTMFSLPCVRAPAFSDC